MSRVLIVLTGSDHWTLADGTKHPSGYWPEELVVPHRILREEGVDFTIATPGGVPAGADENGFTPEMNGGDAAKGQQLRDYIEGIRDELNSPARLEDMDPADFDAILVPGGHGPMEDLAVSDTLGAMLVQMLDSGKVVSAVCHGPAGLLPAAREDGTWAFAGRRLTGFTNEEEGQVGFAEKAPWLLESRLRDSGAQVEVSEAWGPHVIVDGNVITGQNPASAEPVTRRLLELLSAKA
jgi:putative intracellular protease/amidase